LQTQNSTTPTGQSSTQETKAIVLRCDSCKIQVTCTPGTLLYHRQCGKCGASLKLQCVNCGVWYSPQRWKVAEGYENRFHSKECGREWHYKEDQREKREERERREREEGERLTDEQLQEARLDCAWEVRPGRDIIDGVYCRECGVFSRGHSLPKHLTRKHELNREQYRAKYPDAPLLSCSELALSPRGSGDPKAQAQKLIGEVVTADQLKECRKQGIQYETSLRIFDQVICRHCGGKYGDNLAASHLDKCGLTKEEYKALYPLAPLQCIRVLANAEDRYRRTQKKLAQQGGRPRTTELALAQFGPRLRELLKSKKTTGQIVTIMNHETGKNQSKDYWRNLLRQIKGKAA